MKMKNIIAGLVAAAVMVSGAASVSAQEEIVLNYDLKTYEEVSSKNYVNYFIDYNDYSTNEYVLTEDKTFDINFTDTNVTEIVGVQIAYSAYSKDRTKVTNSVKYVKDYSLSLAKKDYIYNPDVFTSNGVSIPINEVNGINFKPYSLVTLGTSTNDVYGFNAFSIHLICKTKGVEDVRDIYGTCITPALTKSGSVQAPARSYFNTISDKIVDIEVYPFKTTLNPHSYQTANGVTLYENDVFSAIGSRKINNNHYTKPIAVINDAIANGNNVTFTFNSYKGTIKDNKVYSGLNYNWKSDNFGQHLYPYYDNVTYGSYSDKWNVNLFTGAIVINSDLTMQLNDTDAFKWSDSSLTFDWDSITGGKVTDAKDFITSMLLYTPVDWYWDSLEVRVLEDAAEDVSCGEGITADDTDIFEDIVEEEEETVVTTIEEVVEIPVEDSPQTGNDSVVMPIMLVMITVAAVLVKVL